MYASLLTSNPRRAGRAITRDRDWSARLWWERNDDGDQDTLQTTDTTDTNDQE